MIKLISWVSHPNYDIPLPTRHRFTSTKFSDLFHELKNSKVIGTDISPTIKKFENTTIWNFNTYNPKWKKKYDFL